MIVSPDELSSALGSGADPTLSAFVQTRVERLVKNFVGYEVEQATYVDILPRPGEPVYMDALSYGNRHFGYGLTTSGGSVNFGCGGADGTDRLFLKNLPVRSITSVNFDPNFAFGPGTVMDPAAYRLDCAEPGTSNSGMLMKRGGPWAFVTPRSVQVTYIGGWTPDELDDVAGDFKMAVISACQKFYNEVVANRAATRTAGVGAVAREMIGKSEIWYETPAQLTGMMQSLPASVRMMLAERVRWNK